MSSAPPLRLESESYGRARDPSRRMITRMREISGPHRHLPLLRPKLLFVARRDLPLRSSVLRVQEARGLSSEAAEHDRCVVPAEAGRV